MAIKDKGYGESGRCGFERALAFDSEGKPTDYMEADDLPASEGCYLEVIGIDVWEDKQNRDFLAVDLFEPSAGLVTRLFGEVKANTMWKLDRTIQGIFGRALPAEKVQGAGGRMPMETRRAALGRFVKVQVRNGDYDRQDVLIIGDKSFSPPEALVGKTMFDAKTKEPTGAWPTKASELVKARGQSSGPPAADDDDW